MALITLPLGPITSPIFSTGISKVVTFGAVSRTSGLGSMMVLGHHVEDVQPRGARLP